MRCHHCGKEVGDDRIDIVRKEQAKNSHYPNYPIIGPLDVAIGSTHFHKECFEEVAGPEFIPDRYPAPDPPPTFTPSTFSMGCSGSFAYHPEPADKVAYMNTDKAQQLEFSNKIEKEISTNLSVYAGLLIAAVWGAAVFSLTYFIVGKTI